MEYQDLMEKVKKHMGWDSYKTDIWFSTPNPLIGDLTPHEFFDAREEKCVRWINSLIYESTAPEDFIKLIPKEV